MEMVNSPVRVLHINTHDILGGAARAAYRLHKGLERLGQDSSMFVAHRHGDDPAVLAYQPEPPSWPSVLTQLPDRLLQGLHWYLVGQFQAKRPTSAEVFSDITDPHRSIRFRQIPATDVINLHWVADFVDLRFFFATVSQSVPVVWTLHDMNAFTGGCHYDGGCGKYEGTCGACPQLSSDRSGDLSHRIWLRKKKAFAQVAPGRLQFVSPSRWLADALRRSSLLPHWPVTVIPNGVDVENFAPRDRSFARNVLGIPRDAAVILFVVHSSEQRRKGFAWLAEALAGLYDVPNLLIISVGRNQPIANLHAKHLHLGYVDNDRFLSLIYSAADLFAIPSMQDNLPNTVLESIACGTPVVGFDVGGIPDMVRPGVTGLLAPVGDVAGFRAALSTLLQDSALRAELAANCRRIAQEEYALEIQASHYTRLYKSVVKGQREASSRGSDGC